MNDLIDLFYYDINKAITEYEDNIIQKNFVSKTGPIEEIPINLAKGELNAATRIKGLIASLYKKRKTELNSIE